ncbi:hypothetical protein GCM10020366_70560 [Saccharopolyspora gregorii]|uniref:Segregation and condensation protein A n=1 Tax=Saccharopolyspora gregorii TaxID=33914 RepID=A0ABP6S2Y2_9PSEU
MRLDNFEGPFDLLLQLISQHQLDVTEVALHKVTDEFIAYTKALGEHWNLDETTEFLVVAATLLDLKAARLLPAADVEDEDDLALLEARDLLFARLLQYRAYKQVAALFSELEAGRCAATRGRWRGAALREPAARGDDRGGAAAARGDRGRGVPAEAAAVGVAGPHPPAPGVGARTRRAAAGAAGRVGAADFSALVADCEHTVEIVARFLALLELFRRRCWRSSRRIRWATWWCAGSAAAWRTRGWRPRPTGAARTKRNTGERSARRSFRCGRGRAGRGCGCGAGDRAGGTDSARRAG